MSSMQASEDIIEEPRRTRALYKKGQKVIVPIIKQKEDMNGEQDAEEEIVYYGAEILRGEKRTDPETKDFTFWYHVHYMGCNKKYDEWLDEDRLIKYDAELLTGGTSAAADDARRKAREAAEAKRMKERLAEIPSQLRLLMPFKLKAVLLEDYERVMNQGWLLPLPRAQYHRPTVTEILEEWQKLTRRDSGKDDDSQVAEIAAGLRTYFDCGLRHFLLYEPEVKAYDAAVTSDTAPSEIYGAEHLLRLMVKLPELVSVVVMAADGDARNVVALEDHLQSLMNLMLDEQARLFAAQDEYRDNPDFDSRRTATIICLPGKRPGGGDATKDEKPDVGLREPESKVAKIEGEMNE